jgi:divalent metal cation (Fe/Co/Zn/Cd) transporter
MMNRCADRILKLGSLVGNLCVTFVGGFIFLHSFRLVTSEDEESAAASSIPDDGMPAKPLAGIGAALLLLTFVTNEAVVMIRALCR